MAIFRCVGYLIFLFLKESASLVLLADKHTHARNSKINEENRTGKHKWKHAKCNHVQVKPAKQIPSGIRE
jgi:hypothetical protein